MRNALLAAQALKVLAGIGQAAFACWLMRWVRRSPEQTAFAISFATNGLAYALFNLSLPGQRSAGSLPLEARAFLNWIAAGAMLIFVIAILRGTRYRNRALCLAFPIVSMILVADFLALQQLRLSWFEFGGIAIYPATALGLAAFPLVFKEDIAESRRRAAAFFGAALAINSVDHLGAEILRPSPVVQSATIIQIAAMLFVVALWLWSANSSKQATNLVLMVLVCMLLPFLAGVAVRAAAGSYRGVQQSGFIGFGRLAATALLVYASLSNAIFTESAANKEIPASVR